ncbi:hypothetical protein [Brevundimonas sp.]|uniref:hypothetical protein n=1 Tax=Brevundimonas sp. TaxID=1871086 RepID=UPI0035ADE575
MATLVTRIQDLATRIATENKSLRTLLNGNLADLSSLSTTAKTSLVAALNESVARIQTLENEAALINDAADASLDETWSITRIGTRINEATAAVKADILGGAGAAYDTLAELKALLDETDGDLTSITTALGARVRTDVSNQGLTTTQQANARTNIAAIGTGEVGNPDTNFVTTFDAGLA